MSGSLNRLAGQLRTGIGKHLTWFRGWLHVSPATIPEPLWLSALHQLPFLRRMPPAQLRELKRVSEALLARKPIVGAQGMVVSDDMAVLIVAQAALLVVNLRLTLYDDMSAIVVYPAAFTVRQQQTDEAGVVHEWEETLAGEAVGDGGAVVLSWDDLAQQQASTSAHNIVIHEFAHKIDMARGDANGFPPFLAGLHDPQRLADWTPVFSAAYDDFCARVDQLERRLPPDFDEDNATHAAQYDALAATLPLDPYASRDPAEFFAVASEAFFVAPAPLAAEYPQVYQLLSAYYRQNPLKAG